MGNEQNSLIGLEQSLANLNKEDYQAILAEYDNVAWIEYNRILKGKPFSFHGRDYLLQPYRDEYPDLIFYKGRQVEMSEFTMNWLLRKMYKYPYTSALHTFPRTKQCNRFSKQRIDSTIADSPTISEWYDKHNSEQLMRKFVNNETNAYNFYVMGGTWESRKDTVGDAARGLTIDFIAYDERQDHPNDVETVIGEAASHSEYKQTITLGTPKLPGIQFDQQWESSDKHFWHVKCEHCGRFEPITMENILPTDDDDYYYGCPKCKHPINRLNGEWVATNPQKRPLYRGYHINQLMVSWITPLEIMRKFNNPTYPKRRFFNEVLGFAYGGDDVPITMEQLLSCGNNSYSLGEANGRVYAGIDWGKYRSYCIVQNKTKLGNQLVDVILAEDDDSRKHAKIIAKKLRKYKGKLSRVVCDAGPDITRYYNLADMLSSYSICSKRNVWACYYANPPAKVNINWNEKEHYVTVGRSEFIEIIIDKVHDCFFVIPGNDLTSDNVVEMMQHFCNISAEKKVSNNAEYIAYLPTGPDHFLHAKIYADVACYQDSGEVIGSTAGSINRRDNMLNKPSSLLKSKSSQQSSSVFPKFSFKNKKKRRLK